MLWATAVRTEPSFMQAPVDAPHLACDGQLVRIKVNIVLNILKCGRVLRLLRLLRPVCFAHEVQSACLHRCRPARLLSSYACLTITMLCGSRRVVLRSQFRTERSVQALRALKGRKVRSARALAARLYTKSALWLFPCVGTALHTRNACVVPFACDAATHCQQVIVTRRRAMHVEEQPAISISMLGVHRSR